MRIIKKYSYWLGLFYIGINSFFLGYLLFLHHSILILLSILGIIGGVSIMVINVEKENSIEVKGGIKDGRRI